MKAEEIKAELGRQKWSFLFILVPCGLFFIFQILPVIASFFLSFTSYDGVNAAKFVGLANYKQILFTDMRFRKALLNTIYYVLGVVPLGVVVAVIFAVLIDQSIKFKNFFKSVLLLPTITSIVASSVMWQWLFAGEKYGLINYYIVMKLGYQPIDWLMSPVWLMPAIMIMSVWAGLGYNVILFLAGLQTIPQNMYEAAEVDGAGFWHRFFYITIPLLRPTIVFVALIGCITSFQVFEQIYVMTGAGGGQVGGVLDSALTVVPYLYDTAFNKFRLGYASAIAYVIFLIVMVLTLANKRFVQSKVEY